MNMSNFCKINRAGRLIFKSPLAKDLLKSASCRFRCRSTVVHESDGAGISSVLLQYGSDMRDLPVLIHRSKLTEHVGSANSFNCRLGLLEQDMNLVSELGGCKTVSELLVLLEVPFDQITPEAASFALYRLCQLGVNSCVSQYVKKELFLKLCYTCLLSMSTITNTSLINLLECFSKSLNFEEDFIQAVSLELEDRLLNNMFSVSEVCSVIELVSLSLKTDFEIAKKAMTHIMSHEDDINDKNLAAVFSVIKYFKPNHEFSWDLHARCFSKMWWQLAGSDIASILQSLLEAGNQHSEVIKKAFLTSASRWLFMNISDVTEDELIVFISAFTNFQETNEHLSQALHSFMKAKGDTCNKKVIASVMDYFYQLKYLHPEIFNVVALDVEKHCSSYEPYEIFLVLRPFGHLNYLPPNTYNVFSEVDSYIMRQYSNFNSLQMLELIASFMYLKKMSWNIIQKLNRSTSIVSTILSVRNPEKQLEYSKYYLSLRQAGILEVPKFVEVFHSRVVSFPCQPSPLQKKFRKEVQVNLQNLFASHHYYTSKPLLAFSPYYIDFELRYTEDGKVVPKFGSHFHKRLMLVLTLPEHFCLIPNDHLLGEHVAKFRHLEKCATVVQVNFKDYKRSDDRTLFIQHLLEPHILFLEGKAVTAY